MEGPHTQFDSTQVVGEESTRQFWEQLVESLRERLGEHAVERWFSKVTLLKIDSDGVWIETPNLIYQVWIEENFGEALRTY